MTTFCLCEDRANEEVGVRLAVCSVRRHCPGSSVVVYKQNPRQEFVDWLGGFKDVKLIPAAPPGANSWNCKPHSMLPLLRAGATEVVWLDSDVVLAGDPRRIFRTWSNDDVGVCLESRSTPSQGSRLRTEGWGLPLGREFSRSLNSAVVRVTPVHIPLLERWQKLLSDPAYIEWQTRPLDERPLHVWGDQDVLNAILGSVEFAGVPVKLLRTGREVIQCMGARSYTVGERFGGLFRSIPAIVHSGGPKPWVVFNPGHVAAHPNRFWKGIRLIHQVSNYRAVAFQYRDELGVPCDWFDYWTVNGRILRALGMGHHALRGLPLAASASIVKSLQGIRQSFSKFKMKNLDRPSAT